MVEIAYEEAAQEYLRSLPLEHFMESTTLATQLKIILESLDLLKARRADVHVFDELLVQFPKPRQRRPGQVVPDNMVVVTDQPIRAESSYNLPLEPARPFWVMEYVSKHNKRKDYEDSFDKYENDLKMPYYLIYYPDNQELTPYRHSGRKYVSVKPNEQGRYPIPELDLQLALLGGWVQYWHRGELLPLPAEIERELDATRRRANTAERRAEELVQRAEEQARRADEQTRRAEELQRKLQEMGRQLAPSRDSTQSRRRNGGKKSSK